MTVKEIVLSKLKLSTSNTDIDVVIEEIGQKIHNFCNIPELEEIPSALNYTYANMVFELISFNDKTKEADIKSISMGDTSYSFDISGKQKIIDNLILNYEDDLLKFRRTRKSRR